MTAQLTTLNDKADTGLAAVKALKVTADSELATAKGNTENVDYYTKYHDVLAAQIVWDNAVAAKKVNTDKV